MSESKPVTLTPNAGAILALVKRLGDGASPYDVEREADSQIGSYWPIRHTTVYAESERLVKAGLLRCNSVEGGRRRQRLSVTDEGKAALERWLTEPVQGAAEIRDEGLLKVFAGAGDSPDVATERIDQLRRQVAALSAHFV